ncbi:MAG: bifunctional riboflavin kinase/FAD synthetase [Propionibacteriaceae bacterium]
MTSVSTRVAVIGNFDGVHRGHQGLLAAAQAVTPNSEIIAVTFWPHPMSVVRPDKAPKLLCSLAERKRLLLAAGASEVVVIDFTEEFAQQPAASFVAEVLAPLGIAHVVVGENFRFGHRAAGDVAQLTQLAHDNGMTVSSVPLVKVCDEETCSTAIRRALANGDVDAAQEQLGRRFAYRGTVVQGAQRGRELGFPTANVIVPDSMAAPADGVYAGWVHRCDDNSEPLPAAISVGTNPTFEDIHRTVESYVLDRHDLELYGVEIEVEFVARLRGMVKYSGLEPLIAQIHDDVSRTRKVLGLAS